MTTTLSISQNLFQQEMQLLAEKSAYYLELANKANDEMLGLQSINNELIEATEIIQNAFNSLKKFGENGQRYMEVAKQKLVHEWLNKQFEIQEQIVIEEQPEPKSKIVEKVRQELKDIWAKEPVAEEQYQEQYQEQDQEPVAEEKDQEQYQKPVAKEQDQEQDQEQYQGPVAEEQYQEQYQEQDQEQDQGPVAEEQSTKDSEIISLSDGNIKIHFHKDGQMNFALIKGSKKARLSRWGSIIQAFFPETIYEVELIEEVSCSVLRISNISYSQLAKFGQIKFEDLPKSYHNNEILKSIVLEQFGSFESELVNYLIQEQNCNFSLTKEPDSKKKP